MTEETPSPRFSYADYESAIRAPEYAQVRRMSAETAALFQGRRRVLDVASGQGFVLDALDEIGIDSVGVDTEPSLVDSCRARGRTAVLDDALHFLATTSERFDGVNCSHFIEHLPYEQTLDLVEGVRRVLLPGGVFVLRWPNPRSLEMQHLSFWRDPTHVRFYDGKIIEAILIFYGFTLIETHYEMPSPRRYSASDAPPAPAPPEGAARQGLKRVKDFLLNGPLRNTPIRRRWAAHIARREYGRRLRHLMDVPQEAQVIACRPETAAP